MKNKNRKARQEILESEKAAITRPRGPSGPIGVAMVFPNRHALAMSNLGYRVVCDLFDELPSVTLERAFFDPDKPGDQFRTVESDRLLSAFDLVAFTISYEMEYPRVVLALKSGSVSINRHERSDRSPIVMAGGVCAFMNPAPMTDIIDVFAVGEGEEIVQPTVDALEQVLGSSRMEKLEALSRVDGLYVPEFHGVGPETKPVTRLWKKKIGVASGHSEVNDGPFGGAYLTEVGRGCGRACRFCAAGFVYLPVRRRTVEEVLQSVENSPPSGKIGMVGAAISDHPKFAEMCVELVNRGHSLGTSSFRADQVDPHMASVLAKGGMRTLTIAPEGGSEKIRSIINKDLTEDDIVGAARVAGEQGIDNLKLYFMYGFPGETDDDLVAIADLSKKVLSVFKEGGGSHISVSYNALVPKPATPFQFVAIETEKELRRRHDVISSELKNTKIRQGGLSPREAVIQTVLSVGGPEVGRAIELVAMEGMGWRQAFREAAIDLKAICHTEKSLHTPLPWDFIVHPLKKEWLWEDFLEAKAAAQKPVGLPAELPVLA